jgi:thiamine-phosphate pyrophosphorylase
MILGLSVETEALAAAVDPAVVDYVGAGPVFATQTKPAHKPPVGMEGLARLVAATSLPAVAIGGLKTGHVEAVLKAGARGVAVVSAICGQPDPQAAALELSEAIRKARS